MLRLLCALALVSTTGCYLTRGPGGFAPERDDGSSLTTPRDPKKDDCSEYSGSLLVDGILTGALFGSAGYLIGTTVDDVELGTFAYAPVFIGMMAATSFFINFDLQRECSIAKDELGIGKKGGASRKLASGVQEVSWMSKPPAGEVGSTHLLYCPKGGLIGQVWGSGVYTDDSSICTAAVLEGYFASSEGGIVEIEIVDGQSSYLGIEANGVRSRPYGPWKRSFRIVKPVASAEQVSTP